MYDFSKVTKHSLHDQALIKQTGKPTITKLNSKKYSFLRYMKPKQSENICFNYE